MHTWHSSFSGKSCKAVLSNSAMWVSVCPDRWINKIQVQRVRVLDMFLLGVSTVTKVK